jgi:Domain of unknown function (DUF4249)
MYDLCIGINWFMNYRRYLRVCVALVLISLAISCLDPFDPPTLETGRNFLVVDGFVDSGNKSASVKLSTSVALDAPTNGIPVFKAIVQIESPEGKVFSLTEGSNGIYSAASINIEHGENYKLRIKAGGREYLSTEIQLRRSPVLDSVTWRAAPDGVTIYVDSHDITGATKYYQWTYTETWEYNAEYLSNYEFDPKTTLVKQRRPGGYVYVCYNTASSSRVLIASTTQNRQDVVSDFPLAFHRKGTKKLSRLYSILVEQRAMDELAYRYWSNLQRTTENLGGLFDPLPAEVTGNVHNIANESEPVLGYFAGGEVQQKRLFINHEELPRDLQVIDKLQCEVDSIQAVNLSLYKNYPLQLVNLHNMGLTYTASSAICVDCRLSGGVLAKPSFWPR